ncbi:MAG: hypothetical protein ACLPOO_06120 [Terriglobales bacterium]|jgi:hypothetical protein
MRYLLCLFVVAIPCFAGDSPCVILKFHHHQLGDNFWTMHAPYDYVEGDFPKGMKFRSAIGDKQIQAIKDKGGKVVIVPREYGLPDLQDARKQCGNAAAEPSPAVPGPTQSAK